MKILFVNPPMPQCGVHQYGLNLFNVLHPSERHIFEICHPASLEQLHERCKLIGPDIIIYNWSAPIGGWMEEAPFPLAPRHVAVFHAGSLNFGRFDAVLFSDPTMKPEGNIFPIGRPLPEPPSENGNIKHDVPWIGVNGFCGACAQNVVAHVAFEFDAALVRLHLPSATFGDGHGFMSREAASGCKKLIKDHPGIKLEISHDFLPTKDLVARLAMNDLNCYIRGDLREWGNGVSSVLDVALAARKPIAINRFHGFRHLHNCDPSILIEENSLPTIIANGLKPLEPIYERFKPERVRTEVEECLEKIS